MSASLASRRSAEVLSSNGIMSNDPYLVDMELTAP